MNRNYLYKSIIILILCLTVISGCRVLPYTQREVEEYVADNVPEACGIVSVSKYHGVNSTYLFRSRYRDLEFYVDMASSKKHGRILLCHYASAVYYYYYQDLIEECDKCPCERESPLCFHIKSEEDLKAVSRTLAKCNEIISDQWNYTPGEDLTDPNLLGVRFDFYFFEEDGSQKPGIYHYMLNGTDDAETIYNQLKEQWE